MELYRRKREKPESESVGIIVPAPTSKTLHPQAHARAAFGTRERNAASTRTRNRPLEKHTLRERFFKSISFQEKSGRGIS
jgi:hypothetical protein